MASDTCCPDARLILDRASGRESGCMLDKFTACGPAYPSHLREVVCLVGVKALRSAPYDTLVRRVIFIDMRSIANPLSLRHLLRFKLEFRRFRFDRYTMYMYDSFGNKSSPQGHHERIRKYSGMVCRFIHRRLFTFFVQRRLLKTHSLSSMSQMVYVASQKE